MKIKNTIILIIICLSNILNVKAQTSRPNKKLLLQQMTAAITQNEYAGVHSILISHDKNLEYEDYFNGFNKDSLHDSRSSFKSITSLLIGIAIDKGMIKSTSQKIMDFFPEYTPKNADPRKHEITIQNLLDMESGFDCEEFNDSKDCEDDMTATNNWVKFSLDLPMKNKPGTVWSYTSCNPMILSGIIAKSAKMSVMDFAKKYLFEPLKITKYKWTVDPSGNGMTAGSFFIRPDDMLTIGEMVRDGGRWNKQQIVSKKWIQSSASIKIQIPDFSFTKISRSKVAIPQQTYYGNYWYKEVLKTPLFQENLLFASGNGGQYIFIIKRLNLVVVFTQGNYNNRIAKQAFDILARFIIPAFEKAT